MLVRPRAARHWVGSDADSAQVAILSRALGARDAVLGIGTLVAIARGQGLRAWLGMCAAVDAGDTLAQIAGFRSMPVGGATLGLLSAPVAALTELAVAIRPEAKPSRERRPVA